jgi:hypothetical protein
MVYLYRSCLYCILYFASQIAFASVVNFPNSNTVPTTSGTTAKLVGVTSINGTSRTASVVIDARDRFGNKMRLFKTATFNSAKIRAYAKNCLSNPVACAAASALTAALIYYGYSISPDGTVVLPGNAGSYIKCVDKPVPIDGAGVANALGPLPCALGPNWAGIFSLFTLEPMPPSPHLIQVQQMNGFYFVGESQGHSGVHYQNYYNAEPRIESETQPISDEQLAEIALENPALIQIAPGVYPDIFNPLEISETLPEEAIPAQPDPEAEENPSAEPEYEDMIGMDAIPEYTVDVASYFDWGSGWLPKNCPPPKVQSFQGQQFSFDLSFACETIADYLAPAVRVFAIFVFLGIVIGGVRV